MNSNRPKTNDEIEGVVLPTDGTLDFSQMPYHHLRDLLEIPSTSIVNYTPERRDPRPALSMATIAQIKASPFDEKPTDTELDTIAQTLLAQIEHLVETVDPGKAIEAEQPREETIPILLQDSRRIDISVPFPLTHPQVTNTQIISISPPRPGSFYRTDLPFLGMTVNTNLPGPDDFQTPVLFDTDNSGLINLDDFYPDLTFHLSEYLLEPSREDIPKVEMIIPPPPTLEIQGEEEVLAVLDEKDELPELPLVDGQITPLDPKTDISELAPDSENVDTEECPTVIEEDEVAE